MTYKVGDRVKATIDCSGVKAGRVYTVKAGAVDGSHKNQLFIWDDETPIERSGCSCSETWLPLTDVISKDSLVAGETVIVNRNDETFLVLEVFKNTFITSRGDVQDMAGGLFTFKEAIANGWKIKLPPEQETIEIQGKKYNKAELEERIKELKPIE